MNHLHLIAFSILLMAYVVSANVFSSWYSSLGNGYNALKSRLVSEPKEANRIVLQTGVVTPLFKLKLEKETGTEETCELRFGEHDILMLTLIQRNDYRPAKSMPPIIMDPKSIHLQLKTNSKLNFKNSLAKILELSKLKSHEIPVRIHLKKQVISKLPKPNNNDLFVLTILKKGKDGTPKIKSHFVESITIS